MKVSVIVPVYNGSATIEACVRALLEQSLSKECYEIVVVDDGSTDATAEIVQRYPVRLLRRPNGGAPAARNTGVAAATGTWVAFTDADCVPSRTWLARLLDAVERTPSDVPALGAAGRMIGFDSTTDAARFVDISGGLDAERYLAHPTFPFAPSGNLMYRRDALVASGGYDERYATYDACDLHTRLRAIDRGGFHFAKAAVVLHRQRATWRQYWKQQFYYGVGYAQFMLRWRDRVRWNPLREIAAFAGVVRDGIAALLPAKGDEALRRRGAFVRAAAQHAGRIVTYYDPAERRRW
ncbi:MAG: glycosyltransferase [Vulcanimicrobiaceae bacterium]